ncbi:UNVERIFIED_CONTAM: hypothetical protein PYX00_004098 [Menopon gallinae]|uniref:Protein kinase domain-containing protein n=1 Tax=Menopon gallinae TaxID=328185 RepID=A0AAW2I393_9NEOP
MDVLNKLRSTVTSTVSQISGVLPGNPVTREFEVTNHICSAGPGLLWKVYEGYKKSTKQDASIFVFEKKLLEKWPREKRDAILESMKRGIIQLTRLRHPQILIVQHPLEESRESLAFATEPVFASLANVLGNRENMPTTNNRDFKLYDVEIKYGLLQVAEGLAFLHNDVKFLHQNISPEVIILNHLGAWKIFGFDFCILNDNKQDGQTAWVYSRFLPHVSQPNLEYFAPENLSGAATSASDMFSLGILIYAIYNDGSTIINCNDDYDTYKKRVNELKSLPPKLNNIPEGLREYEKMLLHHSKELRPDAHQFTKLQFFDDIGVKTLNYLDSLFQWDKVQKSQFYKGLPPIIQKFPHRVCINRVIPCLANEFANPTMVPFVLPSVLQIAESCSQQEYMTHVFPHLRLAMKMTDPIQILLIFMQKMPLLLKLTPAEEVKTDVLPMLYRALESDAQQIQELCLSVLPTYSGLIDYPSMKNAVLPRIKKLCISSNYISVRVNCLVCIGKLLENLDKWLVLDDILPFLPQIPTREPAVLMGILGIYKIALTHKKLGIPKEIIATKVVPFLMPLTVENGLTLNQFNTLFSVLKDMITRVETEHRSKIEQLSAISQQTSMINSATATASKLDSTDKPKTDLDLEMIFSTVDISKPPEPFQSADSLTLEEKQRLMKQQETHQRFNMQPQLMSPTAAPTEKPKSQPKDLTDTLLESNLKEMKWTSTSFNLQNNFDSTLPVKPGIFTSPQVPSVFPSNQGMSPTWGQPLYSSFNSSMQSIKAPLANSTNIFPNQGFQQQNAFNQSMIGSSNMNILSPISSNSQQKTKALTSSEINDLLS